jgi:NitT/TauT family transport system substrate-binding protein
MLQDHIFVEGSWLAEAGNEAIAVRFLRASFRGWIYCRDNFDECVDIVLDNGPTLGEGHMRWMLNEINALIWPSPDGIGVMNDNLYQQTVDISVEFEVIPDAPSGDAVRTDLAKQALTTGLSGADTTGANYVKQNIAVTAGGE